MRTLVALHDDVRYVLAPVELRLEQAGTGGRGVLRVVLLDARLSKVMWIGEFSSDTLTAFGPAVTAGIAAKLASAVAVAVTARACRSLRRKTTKRLGMTIDFRHSLLP